MSAAAPLAGLRVLDFTWVVAGPVATRILADFGAEVIKVERKLGLAAASALGPRKTGLEGELNRSKLSVAINMAEARGVELARRLAARSDLVIDNFSARVMRNWGMDYQSLRALKPDIICISMSGFGHGGPRANYVSFGPTLQAMAGYTLSMAEEDGAPAGFGYSYADMAAGYSGALAALIALWHRRRTGAGQFIDLSQFEALVSVTGPLLLDVAANGLKAVPPLRRSQERPAAPDGVYRCRPRGEDDDRWLALSVATQAQWEAFIGVLGAPNWSADPKFRTLYLRMRNRPELDEHVARWAAGEEAEAAMAGLQRAGVPAGVVANAEDLCARDPQLQSRGFFATVAIPGGTTRLTGLPFKLSRTPGTVRRAAPEPGEDNDYVLGEVLGLSSAERGELIAAGAVWP